MKVLLAHRDPGLRAGLRRLLRRLPYVRLVGQASTGKSTIRRARLARPAVAILGSDLRGPGCLETVRTIKTIRPRTQFIVLTARHTKVQVRAARRSGANYCLPVRTLGVRLPSLLVLAHRDYLAAAGGSAPGSRGRRKNPRARGGHAALAR
ncbi:MAG TPA: response regulator [Candidatus Polarisedimenticolia bacterium]|nr:response regulator [Candidatus Polarisedimenticolia bacterium]